MKSKRRRVSVVNNFFALQAARAGWLSVIVLGGLAACEHQLEGPPVSRQNDAIKEVSIRVDENRDPVDPPPPPPPANNGQLESCFPQALYLTRDDDQFCSGVLIAPNKVLTAAHCLSGDRTGIQVGRGDVGSSPTIAVTESSVHPRAAPCEDGDDTYVDPADDLAVLTLATPITDIPPVELGGGFVGDAVRFVGYGLFSESDTGPAVRRGFGINITESRDDGSLVTTQNGIGTCNGDSGGPLFAADQDCNAPLLVGILHGGNGRCGAGRDFWAGMNNTDNLLYITGATANLPAPAPLSCCPNLYEPCAIDAPGLGICTEGNRTCSNDGEWGMCQSNTPGTEVCQNSTDDDCDGEVDEGCDPIAGGADCLLECSFRSQCAGQLMIHGVVCNCNAPCPFGNVCDSITQRCEPEVGGGGGSTCTLDGVCDPGETCACDAYCCGGGGGGGGGCGGGGGGGGSGGGGDCTYDGGDTITYEQCFACGGEIEDGACWLAE